MFVNCRWWCCSTVWWNDTLRHERSALSQRPEKKHAQSGFRNDKKGHEDICPAIFKNDANNELEVRAYSLYRPPTSTSSRIVIYPQDNIQHSETLSRTRRSTSKLNEMIVQIVKLPAIQLSQKQKIYSWVWYEDRLHSWLTKSHINFSSVMCKMTCATVATVNTTIYIVRSFESKNTECILHVCCSCATNLIKSSRVPHTQCTL